LDSIQKERREEKCLGRINKLRKRGPKNPSPSHLFLLELEEGSKYRSFFLWSGDENSD